MSQSLEEKFWESAEIRSGDDCWPWIGSKINKIGRGCIWLKNKRTVAADASLILHGKDKPFPTAFACHTCDNPNCVNPNHLWWGTVGDHVRDASAKKRLR